MKHLILILFTVCISSSISAQFNFNKIENEKLNGSDVTNFYQIGDTYFYFDGVKVYKCNSKNTKWIEVSKNFGDQKKDAILYGLNIKNGIAFVTKDGMIQTTDNGLSWNFITFPSGFNSLSRICNIRNTLFAYCFYQNDYKILRSIDNALNWNVSNNATNLGQSNMYSVDEKLFFMRFGQTDTILKYSDDGININNFPSTGLPANNNLGKISVGPGNKNYLFAILRNKNRLNIFRYSYNLKSWELIKNNFPDNYDAYKINLTKDVLLVNLFNRDASKFENYESTDFGNSWKKFSPSFNSSFPEYEQRFESIQSLDNKNSFLVQFKMNYEMKAYPYIYGSGDGIEINYISTDSLKTLKRFDDGIASNDLNQTVVFDNAIYTAINQRGVIKSDDHGITWSFFNPINYKGSARTVRLLATNNFLTLIYGEELNYSEDTIQIFRLKKGFSNWEEIKFPKGISDNFDDFQFLSCFDNSIIAIKSDSLFRSNNVGDTWSNITNEIPVFNNNLGGYPAFYKGKNSLIAYLNTNYIYQSLDNGKSWIKIINGIVESNQFVLRILEYRDNLFAVVENGGIYQLKKDSLVWVKYKINGQSLTLNKNIIAIANDSIYLLSRSNLNENAILFYSKDGEIWNNYEIPESYNIKFDKILSIDSTLFITTRNFGIFSNFKTVKPGLNSYLKDLIFVYPNPAQDYIYIEGEEKIENIGLYNLLGQQIFNIQQKNKIDVKNIPNGFYLLRIKTENKDYSRKIEILRN